ncbi:DedA family protein [Rhabdaerophilum sp. SD176]|uniref:DedA family protein n=1 Tax=Rhabdaerophilum sp. SD176 TaxID=2983548 RepID=UPI0024E036F6|nr:DedA family protein [Rhabdaerophilum sp. SD176]
MASIQSLFQEYGIAIYALLFAYCLLKSGSLPLFAGYAAHIGYLDIVFVGAATFSGGYLGDELRFWVARGYGSEFLKSKPEINNLLNTGRHLLDRYGVAYIFLYRYPKGMRTVGALPVGLTNIAWPYFTFLNFLSATIWATILVGAGYLFGSAIESAINTNWGAYSILALVIFVGLTLIAWWQVRRIQPRKR